MKQSRGKEHKVLSSFVTKVDGDQGIVEHTVAVMGNVDLGGDRIHLGAFVKTITERAGQIRVMDTHNSDSVLNVIGKPLALWEVDRGGLPAEVLQRFPDATGALMARTQFLMDTPEGKGAFVRIRDGAVGEYSIGYDPLDFDFSEEQLDGKSVSVRNLRQIRLWEYSAVPFGMNPALTKIEKCFLLGSKMRRQKTVLNCGGTM
jgi:HK97 family phage prohead protease